MPVDERELALRVGRLVAAILAEQVGELVWPSSLRCLGR